MNANQLSGGNQWDTAAFLRACAEKARGITIRPMREALESEGVHDEGVIDFAQRLAWNTLRASGYYGVCPSPDDFERAADWLDWALDLEADERAENAVRSSEIAG